ncbi:hypothetical protein C5167_023683 [Papaver somniferum]|uniref:Glycosyltransferase n=1 Tax=Papaver somniferum TaxID=3469 RepID=A0A4Y7JPI4_PAPSO|nr:hydroquinone glucosyltransferase-like [Papaver somniferum]RZC61932.1 hypothetical protein C5167_023683 [Papaver somniferum]
MEETYQSLPPHVIILPSPGMGHLIPLTEFAKRLVLNHGIIITFTIPTESINSTSEAQKLVLDSLPGSINSIFLSPVNLSDIPNDVPIGSRIVSTVTRSLSSLIESLKIITSSHRVVALVVDIFGTSALDVANEYNITPYIFFPSTAMYLSLLYHLPVMDQAYSCEYRDVSHPIQIPGCVPIWAWGTDLLDLLQDRKPEIYNRSLQYWRRLNIAAGILLNSSEDLEPGPIKALNGKEWDNPPVYPIGPLIRTGVSDDGYDQSGCLQWLDNQPVCSVLFISFGSAGTLSNEKLTELALGLEMSQHKFLWVLRSPTDTSADANYLNSESVGDPFEFLPKGFLDRTRVSGLVVSSWAPQVRILSHRSTGGFLTHCGWNSTLESVINGVPLIAWPLFAEQKMNAVMLTDDLKVALRPKVNKNGIIESGEISRCVKGVMGGEEGHKLRCRMGDLKGAAASSLSEGGSSFKSLAEVANKWKNL